MTFTAAELAVLKRYDHAMDGILHEPDIKEQRKLERRKRANQKYRERMREALNRIRREKKAKANAKDDGAGASPAPVHRIVGPTTLPPDTTTGAAP
jgi:hypothetical protein